MFQNFLATLICFFALIGCVSPMLSSERIIQSSQNQTVPAHQGAPLNLGVLEINDPSIYNKVFVISDIHGMYDQLEALLKAGHVISDSNDWIAGRSLFIVVGDSIDKGPKSLEVLDLFIKLQEQASAEGGAVIHVLGNHEAEFLADPINDTKAAELINEMKAQNVPLTDLTTSITPRGLFLHSEPLAAKVGHWLFCHSGFYPDMVWADFKAQAKLVLDANNYGSDFLIGKNSILEAKDWEKSNMTLMPVLKRMDNLGVFGIVFGHQPTAFKIVGRSAAKVGGRLIKIDNGIPPESGSHKGSLLVFDNPAQMSSDRFPQINVISPDGSEKPLIPE